MLGGAINNNSPIQKMGFCGRNDDALWTVAHGERLNVWNLRDMTNQIGVLC
jgi:hypothetical protein